MELLLKLLVDCYLIVWPIPHVYQHTSFTRLHNLKEQIIPICKAKVDMLNVFHRPKMQSKILALMIIVYISCADTFNERHSVCVYNAIIFACRD